MTDQLKSRQPATALFAPTGGRTPATAAAYAPPTPPEPPPDWGGYLRALRRYRWWVLASAAVGTMGGFAATRVLPPRYIAESTIWIQTTDPRGGWGNDRGPIGGNQLLVAPAWGDLLKSYVVLDAVVRERRLYLETRTRDTLAFTGFAVSDSFQPGDYRLRLDQKERTYTLEGKAGELERGSFGADIGARLGFQWHPPAEALAASRDVKFTLHSARDAAKRLAQDLHAVVDPTGNFLRVSLSGVQGKAVTGTVNAIVDRYVAVATELRRAKLTELARLLGEQVGGAQDNLHHAESALATFRAHSIMLTPDPSIPTTVVATPGTGGTPVTEYFARRFERDQVQSDRAAIAQALRDSAGSVGALARIGAVQHAPDLASALQDLTAKRAEQRALLARYTEDHPAARRLSGDIATLEQQTIPALARKLEDDLLARERLLTTQIGNGGRELAEIPQRTIDEARLRRDVTIAEELFATVQQRYNEARLAEASSIADVRVLDAAVEPELPAKNLASGLLTLGLVAGIGLGLVGAIVADRVDPHVRYPQQVTDDIGLSILGVLPHVKSRNGKPVENQVVQVHEAMRSVRLNLIHAHGTGPIVATVTSPGAGDGKSFLSTNLALSFAHAGRSTILVDGDTRRGALHRTLGLSRKPGLTDLLAGQVPLERALQVYGTPNLHFIGAGSRVHDSPELLGAPEMVQLLVQLRNRFQVILVDSPPLGAGVDPYTLGTLTGSMVVVLRTGITNLAFARSRLAMLQNLPVRMLGVVLNDVPPGGLYSYYAYLTGYGTVDETALVAAAAPRRAR